MLTTGATTPIRLLHNKTYLKNSTHQFFRSGGVQHDDYSYL